MATVLLAVNKSGTRFAAGAGLFRLFAENFLGFLHQSAFAKLRIILVRFASAILESLSFPVYVFVADRCTLVPVG